MALSGERGVDERAHMSARHVEDLQPHVACAREIETDRRHRVERVWRVGMEPGDTRNEFMGSTWSKLDMRVALDFPGFRPEHRATAFFVVDNLTNLLNDDWGVLDQHNFPRTVVRGTPESRIGDASRYEIRFGVKYNFDRL